MAPFSRARGNMYIVLVIAALEDKNNPERQTDRSFAMSLLLLDAVLVELEGGVLDDGSIMVTGGRAAKNEPILDNQSSNFSHLSQKRDDSWRVKHLELARRFQQEVSDSTSCLL